MYAAANCVLVYDVLGGRYLHELYIVYCTTGPMIEVIIDGQRAEYRVHSHLLQLHLSPKTFPMVDSVIEVTQPYDHDKLEERN